jgi:hypothetical protein
MAPVADFLDLISDSKPNVAFTLWPQILLLCVRLEQMPAGSPGKLLADVMVPLLRFPFDEPSEQDRVLRRTLKFFFYAHLFSPSKFVELRGEPWIEHCVANDGFSPAAVRAALGFTTEELPDHEWLRYHKWSTDANFEGEPSPFWHDKDCKHKRLQRIALYLLNMPCVVTSCDSVISTMGQMFTEQQSQLGDQQAGELVAFRCNGDVAQAFGGSMHSGWMNRNAHLKEQDLR